MNEKINCVIIHIQFINKRKGVNNMPYVFWTVIFLIVFIDRWTKRKTIKILGNRKGKKSVELIQDKLKLMLQDNKIKHVDGLEGGLTIIIKITLIALLCAIIYLIKLTQYQGEIGLKLALSFIIGGGFGNFIDRLGHGYVIDFICIKGSKNIVFNLSRIFIITGIILLLFNI
ncbi:peptidase A8 [Clostridium haemolyticum NCTC 8350]|nr:peptidase A8 [Clostridium haemolyticum NCTC 8350]OOB76170.1 peptidase A8 [Clostridium haemolyticum]